MDTVMSYKALEYGHWGVNQTNYRLSWTSEYLSILNEIWIQNDPISWLRKTKNLHKALYTHQHITNATYIIYETTHSTHHTEWYKNYIGYHREYTTKNYKRKTNNYCNCPPKMCEIKKKSHIFLFRKKSKRLLVAWSYNFVQLLHCIKFCIHFTWAT